jgi:hypothetical protein
MNAWSHNSYNPGPSTAFISHNHMMRKHLSVFHAMHCAAQSVGVG